MGGGVAVGKVVYTSKWRAKPTPSFHGGVAGVWRVDGWDGLVFLNLLLFFFSCAFLNVFL